MEPSPQAYKMFSDLMKMLLTKTKKELMEMAMSGDCPDFIQELILTHPALLGDPKTFQARDSEGGEPIVKLTEDIIKAHGFRHTYEWEYECEKKDMKPKCLRIWLGKKRTKKNLRVLTLTEQEATQVQAVIAAEQMVDNDTLVAGVECRRCGNTLPPHTAARHLDVNDPIHKCPHQ